MKSLEATTDLFRLLGDPTRVRILALLEREELTVVELRTITGLAQSRVSTHLARLRDAGFVLDRRAGGSVYYRLGHAGIPQASKRAWEALRDSAEDPLLESDADRAREIVAARAAEAEAPAEIDLERRYVPGRGWESLGRALFGLLRLGDVVDIGCGDGAVAELLAPGARSITCVDTDPAALGIARRRLVPFREATVEQADMHRLPFPAGSFDEALLLNCLPFSREPARALAEAARVLRAGGRLLAVTLKAHAHEEAAGRFGHVHLGFEPAELAAMLRDAGIRVERSAVTSRERRAPHFEILTAMGVKR